MSAPSQFLRDTLARWAKVRHLPSWRALAAERRWLVWSFGPERSNGKMPTLPRSAVTGSSRGWGEHHALTTLSEALDFAQTHRCDGVGLCPGAINGAPALWCGDIDGCASRNADGRLVVSDTAKAFFRDKEPCWIEISPSGRGLRTIALGETKSAKSAGVELFADTGYVTVSFDRVRGDDIGPAPKMLAYTKAR